ncbi:unnamed protein product [Ceratitis capitata]|uniref:(Mediterranean fruit fly) hypothetical protein n=1 Tax=Ceratitis capitata TaxID=7213 RepID=A0A811UCN7_CERCA|nr:unnamed protein product [Ceratitis capitata]
MRGGAAAEVVKGSGGFIKACRHYRQDARRAPDDGNCECSPSWEIEGLQKRPAMAVAAERALMPAPPVPALGAHAATLPKPEVVQKVVKEVCPNLKVRVHEVKAGKGGGAIIRTPSVAERGERSPQKRALQGGGVERGSEPEARKQGCGSRSSYGDHS